MTAKRDLAEAHAFQRRRLVTAFLAGHREPEGPRAGRALLGGLALALVVLAGAAVARTVAPRTPSDWTDPGLVVSRERGVAYVILERSSRPVLHPVATITSARLLGVVAAPVVVPQDAIDRQRVGVEVGARGVPARLPPSSRLLDAGWSACTADRAGLRLDLSSAPEVVAAPSGGLVVSHAGRTYLVATGAATDADLPGAYAYELPRVGGPPGDNRDNLLADLGVATRGSAPEVPRRWLALLPTGGRLAADVVGLEGVGEPVPYAAVGGLPPGARVGDVVTAGDRSLLLTAHGPTPLDPFALTVYRYTADPSGRVLGAGRVRGGPRETLTPALPPLARAEPTYAPAHWPDRLLEPAGGEPCVELAAGRGRAPRARLAADPGPRASAADVRRGRRVVTVAAGRGALVRAGDRSGRGVGPSYVVDSRGTAYALVGEAAAQRLGYAGHRPEVVPRGWLDLLDRGVDLRCQRMC